LKSIQEDIAQQWFLKQQWKPHLFQQEAWQAFLEDRSGLINAPTGSGKTYSAFFGILLNEQKNNPAFLKKKKQGLKAIWITPIRALAKEIHLATERVIKDMEIPWEIGIRTGDTTAKERTRQKKQIPEFLITTPESLQLLLAQKGYKELFSNLETIVVDEWHELIGSKRGVQMELALSRLKALRPSLKIWGISATIGNLEEAMEILLGDNADKGLLIKSSLDKKVVIETILPDKIEAFPWAGHIGTRLLPKILPIIEANHSTLIFTNTRAQAEIWYRHLMEAAPELAGLVALHHGSLDSSVRAWVEEALHEGRLKAVVCTSSLDLGVDFRPVEAVVQIGSPKGVGRFMQRAGRSGHQPGAVSKIYFLPTNSLEIIEGAAMREALRRGILEERIPYIRSFDVLIQYLVTLAVSDGFDQKEIYKEVKTTFSYNSITEEEWAWVLHFIVKGGKSLFAYDEFHKVIIENGIYKVVNRAIAMRHRLSMGTIVSDAMMQIKFVSGKRLGSIEEYFISRLNPGDVFWFAGRNLELVRIHNMEVQVKKTNRKNGQIPSYQGGRMPLSSKLSEMIRIKLDEYHHNTMQDPEMLELISLFEIQEKASHLPHKNEFLIETMESKEGYHIYMYPFEGRNVHEGMAAILANRIAKITPFTFSIAMNDYGFELLSDREIPLEEALEVDLFNKDHLYDDIQQSLNATEMARRKFRDIASIGGLVFQGFPGKAIKTKHLQASSVLFFKVFEEFDKTNLLLKQAYEEVIDFQLEITRMRYAFERISNQKIIVKKIEKPSPFAFPILVDRLRERFTNEELIDRIKRMKLE
jgi:ATP-dependent helicase Lhr and Lhr-like helicase